MADQSAGTEIEVRRAVVRLAHGAGRGSIDAQA
jgi:hypothetical protein